MNLQPHSWEFLVQKQPRSLSSDCEVDFATPLDYKESIKPVEQIKKRKTRRSRDRRLDEKPGEGLVSYFVQEKKQTVDAGANVATE
ncbi:conserved hypothetical protein [Ricinus communis]|uniref:Uncharacterized protein n=1 Tax=Ricinus communis TaxID=3988 RepID=B9SX43_RICCO|nr:conserved hypothetical protein [Ricinus communis]